MIKKINYFFIALACCLFFYVILAKNSSAQEVETEDLENKAEASEAYDYSIEYDTDGNVKSARAEGSFTLSAGDSLEASSDIPAAGLNQVTDLDDEQSQAYDITIYTIPRDPSCMSAKKYLRDNGFNFNEVDVSISASNAKQLVEVTGQEDVPVFVINGEKVIGFQKNKIDDLLDIKL